MPWKFEAGTPDIAAAIGLGAAAEYLMDVGHGPRARARARARRLRARACCRASCRASSSTGRWIPTCAAGSSRSTSRASIPTTSPRCSTGRVIGVRAGHHCTMPLHERLDLAATARASFNVYSTREDVDALVAGLSEVIALFGVGQPAYGVLPANSIVWSAGPRAPRGSRRRGMGCRSRASRFVRRRRRRRMRLRSPTSAPHDRRRSRSPPCGEPSRNRCDDVTVMSSGQPSDRRPGTSMSTARPR